MENSWLFDKTKDHQRIDNSNLTNNRLSFSCFWNEVICMVDVIDVVKRYYYIILTFLSSEIWTIRRNKRRCKQCLIIRRGFETKCSFKSLILRVHCALCKGSIALLKRRTDDYFGFQYISFLFTSLIRCVCVSLAKNA